MINQHKKNIELIQSQISQSKSPQAKLVAVSKFFPIQDIVSVYQNGIKDFGENFPQELAQKANELKDLAITWHFIGNIQSNKTKLIAEYAGYVHSLTKISHAKRLNDQRPNDKPRLKVMLEVNISGETNKHGLTTTDELIQLAKNISELPNLELVGLMGMASNTNDEKILTQQFQLVNEIAKTLRNYGYNISELSIGTSNDYLIALNNNSSMIRIGSKIFGERKYDN